MALTRPTMPTGLVDSFPKLTYAGIRAYAGRADAVYCVGRLNQFDGAHGVFVYDAADTTSADNGGSILVDNKGRRWKRQEAYLDMAWFGATPGMDIADAWDTTVAIVDQFVRTNGFEGRPSIYLKTGIYPTSRMLDIPSYVSVVGAGGNVVIDGTGLPDDNFVLRIINKVTGVSTTHHAGINLGCIGGTFKVKSGGKTGAVDGFYVGNTSNMSDVRNVKLHGVATEGVRRSLTLGSINTYMLTVSDSHFETSKVNLYIPNTTSSNSGEKIVFNDTIFGGADDNHMYMATPGMDCAFNNCSFDFTYGNVMEGASTWGYAKVVFDVCHFEGYNGNLIKVAANPGGGSSTGTNRAIFINKPTNLPRNRGADHILYNSPSKLKIDAKNTPVYIDGYDQRSETPPYTEDIFMASEETGLYLAGYIKDAYYHVPHRRYIQNRGWDIGDETVGTIVNNTATQDALTRFSCNSRGNMVAEVVARGSDKQLKLTGTSGSYIRFVPKVALPVAPGGRVGVFGSLSVGSSSGNVQVTHTCVWYDAAGEIIQTDTGFSYNMRTVFDRTDLPNYSEGNSRYIASSVVSFRAPPGAVSCKPSWQFSGFAGDVNVSRMVAFDIP